MQKQPETVLMKYAQGVYVGMSDIGNPPDWIWSQHHLRHTNTHTQIEGPAQARSAQQQCVTYKLTQITELSISVASVQRACCIFHFDPTLARFKSISKHRYFSRKKNKTKTGTSWNKSSTATMCNIQAHSNNRVKYFCCFCAMCMLYFFALIQLGRRSKAFLNTDMSANKNINKIRRMPCIPHTLLSTLIICSWL